MDTVGQQNPKESLDSHESRDGADRIYQRVSSQHESRLFRRGWYTIYGMYSAIWSRNKNF